MGLSIFHRLVLTAIVGSVSLWFVTLSLGSAGASERGDHHVQSVPTATDTLLPPTSTDTPLPPTPTDTPLPPTPTDTPLPPTSTDTPLPPTPTNTATAIPINQPPEISSIADRTINEDEQTGTISFQVTDVDTAAELLSVSASSSNTVLLPIENIQLAGGGSNRTVRLTPALDKHGITTVTLTVSDGSSAAHQSFRLLVRPVNDRPYLDLNGTGSGTGFASTFVANAGAVPIASTEVKIIDVDDNEFISATVSIANPLDGIAEYLSANTAGTEILADYSSGVLYLVGLDTNTNYRKVLRSIAYQNDAILPNTEERMIEFVVNDGEADSNVAISQISLVDPQLSLEMFPDLQSIAQGGSAVFTIQVQNLGSVALEEVNVQDPAVPDCERDLGALEIGETQLYSCSLHNIVVEFTNIASVHGRDSQGHEAYDDDASRVEVANPNVQIIKSPSSQTKLKGEPALFDVFVINTSVAVDLADVEVIDPLVPDCSRMGNHPFSNLAAGEEVMYHCQRTNVGTAFTNVITVTGTNLFTQQTVYDSSIAYVELLDLAASLQANPSSLFTPGGPVSLTLTIRNVGSVDFALTGLSSENLGSLDDPNNAALISNNCASSTLPKLAAGEQFTCDFSGIINGSPPRAQVSVTVEAQDDDKNRISGIATTNISFANRLVHWAYLPVTSYAYLQPDEENDLPCQAFAIGTGQIYYFAPDDQDDWYYFDIVRPGMISISLRQFLPIDGQLAVWVGSSCRNLDTLVGHNANFLPEKDVSFYAIPDRYYVWISNSDGVSYDSPYSLYVHAP